MERANLGKKNNGAAQKKEYLTFWTLYCLSVMVALFALLPRLDSLDFFYGKYLWAEDGNVFLNQAKDLGLSAVLKPYAGYLHVYPRLIAEIAQFFELIYRPMILLLGWFAAYFILIHSILISVCQKECRTVFLAPLIILVALQPSYGEVFFNITNSQWLLGAALCLYAIADTAKNNPSWLRDIFLFVLTLTGPFSVVLAPVLLVKLIIRKDWRDFKRVYFIVFLGASIQLASLLASDRVSSGKINKDPWEWIVSFLKILSFGANDVLTVLSSVAIWLFVIYLILSIVCKRRGFDFVAQTALILLVTAFLLIAAGLVSQKHSPSAIVALGGGNRYTWAPYVLILTSVILLAGAQRVFGGIIIFLFGFICYANFHKVASPDLQFEYFSRFSKLTDVTIPINPQSPAYPGWHIAGEMVPAIVPPIPVEIKLTPETVSSLGLKADFSGQNLEVIAENEDPLLVLVNQISCPPHSHAGVNIYLSRKEEGWMQVFWSTNRVFNEIESLRRWYPSGDIKAQFAFPLNDGKAYIRIDPMENIGSAVIKKIELYCF